MLAPRAGRLGSHIDIVSFRLMWRRARGPANPRQLLGSICISERTVLRYLRPHNRSQPGVFFANHFVTGLVSPDVRRRDQNIVVDAADVSFRAAPSIDTSCASIPGPNIDWVVRSDISLGIRLSHNHLQNRPGARKSSGRDPPWHLQLQSASRRPRRSLWCAHTERPARGAKSCARASCLPKTPYF